MEKDTMTYGMPYVGCLIGTAFQKLTVELECALHEAGLNMTAAEYMILRALYSSDGLQQCELSEMVGKDKASISRSVAGMVRKGLVHQEQISHKCCRVWLSEAASALRPRIMEIAAERHRELTVLASEGEIATFVKVLKAIVGQHTEK